MADIWWVDIARLLSDHLPADSLQRVRIYEGVIDQVKRTQELGDPSGKHPLNGYLLPILVRLTAIEHRFDVPIRDYMEALESHLCEIAVMQNGNFRLRYLGHIPDDSIDFEADALAERSTSFPAWFDTRYPKSKLN